MEDIKDDRELYNRNYVAVIKHPHKGTLVYGGLHQSTYTDPNKDPYRGSGKYILNFIKKYGKDLVSMRWVSEHETKEQMLEAEVALIAQLRNTHGKACVNLNAGGQLYTPPVEPEEVYNKIRNTLKEYRQGLSDEDRKKLGDKISLSLRSRPHWNHYKALFHLWVSEGMPKAERFRRIAVSASYPDCDYRQMVKHFIKDSGDDYNPTPYNYRLGNKSRKTQIWDNYEPLYEIWVKNNKPKYPTFKNIATYLGYEPAYYRTMVEHFKN